MITCSKCGQKYVLTPGMCDACKADSATQTAGDQTEFERIAVAAGYDISRGRFLEGAYNSPETRHLLNGWQSAIRALVDQERHHPRPEASKESGE